MHWGSCPGFAGFRENRREHFEVPDWDKKLSAQQGLMASKRTEIHPGLTLKEYMSVFWLGEWLIFGRGP